MTYVTVFYNKLFKLVSELERWAIYEKRVSKSQFEKIEISIWGIWPLLALSRFATVF
jgi:hypothetical protein